MTDIISRLFRLFCVSPAPQPRNTPATKRSAVVPGRPGGISWRCCIAIMAVLPVALTGCATLSEGECRTADWYQIGLQDGGDGYTRARLHKHSEACSAYGVRPNPERYYAGRQKGLERYCTPRNGFIVGREGKPYRDVCPPGTQGAFLDEYRAGYTMHEVDQRIDAVERDIDRTERRLEADDTPHRERRRLHDDLRDLYDELRHRHRELDRLQRNREHYRGSSY